MQRNPSVVPPELDRERSLDRLDLYPKRGKRSSTVMIISGASKGIASVLLAPAWRLLSVTRVSPTAFAVNVTNSSVPVPLTPPLSRAALIWVILPAVLSIVPLQKEGAYTLRLQKVALAHLNRFKCIRVKGNISLPAC